MAERQEPNDIINSMAENEETIARLYEAYADISTGHSAFWRGLAADEREHASWLHRVADSEPDRHLYINKGRFRERPVRVFREYLDGELARAQREPVSLTTALSIALSIEQALLERKFFEVFETDSVELKHALLRLAESTEAHVKKVREHWSRHKK